MIRAAAVGLMGMMTIVAGVLASDAGQIRDLIHSHAEVRTWHVEHDPRSSATIVAERSTLMLRYAIGGGRPLDQFVALAKAVDDGLAPWRRLTLRASADRPLRLAVQLRALGTKNPPLWRRSIYVDATPRVVTVLFSDMRPVAPARGDLDLKDIGAVLIGLDTVNTRPGTAGTVSFSEITLGR